MSSFDISSSVSFPLTDANQPSVPHPHPHPSYLPFRRISAPSDPPMVYRQSIASMASFDSLQEEAGNSYGVIPSSSKPKRSGSRPTSFEVSRKGNKRRSINDAKVTKRRRIINEFYETERSYVDGLELIYSHFLTPIISSLDTPKQLLDRNELTSVFSNFIDIWNLHRSFFSSLSAQLQTLSSTGTQEPPMPFSPILLSHFPYLSLYTPFVTSFDTALSSYGSLLSSKPEFASFISRQEADPHCGKLKLRDWLLTVVQRCPRYLLLLKDLISCTDTEDPEHEKLTSVHTLVSKITTSLNTSLHTHAQTLSLLAIQRSTPNLPFQLISPGRSLLKRGLLLQLEGSSARDREFLLFSDCFMWLENQDKTPGDVFAERWSSSSSPNRPSMVRMRSRSDAQLLDVRSPSPPRARSKSNLFSPPTKMKQRYASSGTEERWQYKGHIELVDIEVVVSPPQESGGETRLEILSPQISFAVYADSETERDEWAEALRNAKASLLVTLNAINPNSTLTSSLSTNHLRRTLQALPHSPEEADKKPKRGKVEHFVPAIWIPDNKSDACMRCGRSFGWRRRRHHCRLCGRCVCARCSSKTFIISDGKQGEESHKPARACEACYETVFPLIEDSHIYEPPRVTQSFTINNTLSGFPSWTSMRVSALSTSESAPLPSLSSASALMAINLESPKRELTRIDDFDDDEVDEFIPEHGRGASSRVRIKAPSRPRSYNQILEDFARTPGEINNDLLEKSVADVTESLSASLDVGESSDEPDSPFSKSRVARASFASSSFSFSSSPRRKEDTTRKRQRFSNPAVALQTTPVTARSNVVGEGKAKRISLILGKSGGSGSSVNLPGGSKSEADKDGSVHRNGHDDSDEQTLGGAAGKLTELLRRGPKA